jgi:hypothetical protein
VATKVLSKKRRVDTRVVMIVALKIEANVKNGWFYAEICSNKNARWHCCTAGIVEEKP